MRFIVYALGLAALLTILWSVGSGEKDFERATARLGIFYEMGSKCPLVYDETRDVSLSSICSTFGLGAYESARRYPDIAGTLFATYGGASEFAEVLDQYGHIVLPVVQYFRDHDSREFRYRAQARNFLDRLRGEEGDAKPVVFTPDERGLIAINEIKRRGHGMLAEFELVDGGAKRKQVTRAIALATDLFTSGITDLEAAMVRGEKVTWKQVGWASLDATVVLGGASVLIKSLQTAKLAKTGAAAAKAGTAFRTIGTIGKIAAVSTGTVAAVAIISNPSLIAAAAGWIAEHVFGLPKWVGVFVLTLILASALVFVLELIYKFVIGPALWPIRRGVRFANWWRRRHPKAI